MYYRQSLVVLLAGIIILCIISTFIIFVVKGLVVVYQ